MKQKTTRMTTNHEEFLFIQRRSPAFITTSPKSIFPIDQNQRFFLIRQNITCNQPFSKTSPLHDRPETTAATADSADVADLAHRTTVLGMVLSAIEGTRDGGFAAGVDRCVSSATDGEFGESVEFDVDGVCGLALGDGLEFAGLEV